MQGEPGLTLKDFVSVCEKCEKECQDEHYCGYWMHEKELYGSSIRLRSYCAKCITAFELYDGRKEYVCEKCLKYVNLFLSVVGKAYLLEIFLRIKNNTRCETIKDFIYEYSEDLTPDAEKFFDFLEEFQKDGKTEKLGDINFDNLQKWIVDHV